MAKDKKRMESVDSRNEPAERIYRQHFDDGFDEEDPNEYLMENEEEYDERLVVRFVPKAIDYAIFVIQVTILASFFYVAYVWKDLGTVSCYADINSDVPLSKDAGDPAIDVTRYFTIAIRWGFWMSLLTFIRAILAQIGLYLKKWVLLWCSYVLFAANISISIVLFILMQVWRWSHSGQVCSGDYEPNKDDLDRNVYLVFEGKFIKAILIGIYSILGLSCISILIVSICVYKRHAREDIEVENLDSS